MAAKAAIKALNGYDVKGRKMKVEISTGLGREDRRSKTTQKLFIGNVADGTTDQELRDLFEPHCPVVEADVIDGKNFGFVHVDLAPDNPMSHAGREKVEELIGRVHDTELNGNKLRVQASDGGGRGGGGGGGFGGGRGGFGGGRGGYGGGFDGGYGGGGGFDGGYRGRGGPRGGGRGRGGWGPPAWDVGSGPRGRGGFRGRGHRDAPYPSRGGYGGGQDRGYDDYGGGHNGGGPMRGGDYYGGGGGRGGYNDQMYSRRPPSEGPSYGGQGGYGGYGGGQAGGSNSGSIHTVSRLTRMSSSNLMLPRFPSPRGRLLLLRPGRGPAPAAGVRHLPARSPGVWVSCQYHKLSQTRGERQSDDTNML